MSASPIEYHFLYLHKTLFKHLKLHNKITIFTCGHIQNALSSLNSWAQLFEDRLALNPGLNLTRVSFSGVLKQFLG